MEVLNLDCLRLVLKMLGDVPLFRLVCKTFYKVCPKPGCPHLKDCLLTYVKPRNSYTLRYTNPNPYLCFELKVAKESFNMADTFRDLEVNGALWFENVGPYRLLKHEGVHIWYALSEVKLRVVKAGITHLEKLDIAEMVKELIQNTK